MRNQVNPDNETPEALQTLLLKYELVEGQHIRGPRGDFLVPSANRNGYAKMSMIVNGVKQNVYWHRAVWALHYREWPRETVHHADGDCTNNHIDNLLDAEAYAHKSLHMLVNKYGRNRVIEMLECL